MKSDRAWSVAVRDPSGGIQVKNVPLRVLPKALKLPVLRGVVALFHALVIGIQALEFSATASRIGHWDLGVNRERIERLRARFQRP